MKKRNSASKRKNTFGTPHLFSIIFMLILLLPAALSALATVSSAGKPGQHIKAPGIEIKGLLVPEYYRAWGDYLDRRLDMNRVLVKVKRWMDYRVFRMTDVPGVYVGRDGWIFPRAAIDQRRIGACNQSQAIQRVVFDLTVLSHLAKLSGRRLMVTVAPDKAMIYPEHLGALPIASDCRKTVYDLFRET
jgi:hypothetical protein